MKKRMLILSAVIAASVMCVSAQAAEPEFKEVGDKYEVGHFTVEAIALNANSEDFNENADYSVYSINDYTAKVPMADSYDANGATSENNTSTSYVITTDNQAVLIDLGNGAASTASHFGEDGEDEEVLKALDTEYHDLIYSLVGDRELDIMITHNHGDHLGYLTALADENLSLYFPEGDYTDEIVENYGDLSKTYDLQLITPGDFNLELNNGLTVESISCKGHTDDSALYLLDTPVVSYEYDDAGEATDSSAQYQLFTGDAIGSGSSVWLFSADGIKTLTESIGPVYDKMAACTTYNDYLGGEEKDDATLSIHGGHGWQIWNRFGDMKMDIGYIANMKSLLEQIPEGNWVEDGTDGKIEDLLQEGKLVTKPIEGAFLDTTIYFGEDLTEVAGVSTSMDALKEVAGLPVEEKAE